LHPLSEYGDYKIGKIDLNAPSYEAYKTWGEFRSRWPLEKLASMTLAEYSQADDPDCVTYGWLGQRTKSLGSIHGGPMFKL